MTNSHLVLVADDLPHIRMMWVSKLAEYDIAVVEVCTREELDTAFDANRERLSAIILDGCIPGNDINTIPFIQRARSEGFTRPIVASSGSTKYRRMMCENGASHDAPKTEAAELVLRLLGVL